MSGVPGLLGLVLLYQPFSGLRLRPLDATSGAISPSLIEPRENGSQPDADSVMAFGWAVAGVGDINGDGTPDFVVGAPGLHAVIDSDHVVSVPGIHAESEGVRSVAKEMRWIEAERGSVWAFSGKDFAVLHHWYGDAVGSHFGYSVAAAGDVNSDGHADILVGAPGNETVPGIARIYSGKDGYGLINLTSNHVGDGFGASICAKASSGGTVIAVGAPEDEGLGSVWTFTGSDYKGLRVRTGSVRLAHFGTALDLVPDADGDGVLDVIVGAPGSETDRTGAVILLSSSSGKLLAQFADPAPPSAFGAAVRTLVNVDGKGGPGIAVGAPWYGAAPDYGGAVVRLALENGQLGLVPEALSCMLTLDEFRCREDSQYGHALASLGDLDGDGVEDLLVGAPEGFWCGGDVGWAEVGSSKSRKTLHFLDFKEEEVDGEEWSPFEFGRSVDCAGDVDGDGVVDLLVGAPDLWIWGGGVQVASGATGKVIKEILAESVAKQWAR